MQSIVAKIKKRIHSKDKGFVFTKSHFLDLGSRTAVAKALERLADAGAIRRLSRGLYDYPENHPTLGELPVNYERIVQALAGRDNLRVQPSGAYAANLLGLTNQVPAKIVFLTDGSHRKIQIGNQQIILKRTTPKNMATAGKMSGLVIQALRFIGQSSIDDKVIRILKNRLTEKDKKMLVADLRYAPAWVEKVVKRLQQ
jgi:predicted transcriptional regulator of viral defense system